MAKVFFPIFLAFLCLLFSAQFCWAYEKMIARHCKEVKAPSHLAIAIAKQESGLNPLCINIEGQDFIPASRSEAELIILNAAEEDLSYDVGLMQINSQWIKKWNLDPISLLDPQTNIRYGVRILQDEIKRHGPNWRAVGANHSPNPERAMRYASQVFGRMRGSSAIISPRLQLLIDRGIITRAEAKSIMANPRLHGPLRKKTMKALRQKLASREGRNKSELDRFQETRRKYD